MDSLTLDDSVNIDELSVKSLGFTGAEIESAFKIAKMEKLACYFDEYMCLKNVLPSVKYDQCDFRSALNQVKPQFLTTTKYSELIRKEYKESLYPIINERRVCILGQR